MLKAGVRESKLSVQVQFNETRLAHEQHASVPTVKANVCEAVR